MLTVFWCGLAGSLPWEGSGQRNENFFNTGKITLQLSTTQTVHCPTRNIIYYRFLFSFFSFLLFWLKHFCYLEILFKNITWEPWSVLG